MSFHISHQLFIRPIIITLLLPTLTFLTPPPSVTFLSFCHTMVLHNLSYLSLALLLFIRVDSTQPPFSCGPSTKSYPFCRTNLPISQRARDLVSRLSLDEKISQLVNSAPGIPRLGIPAYEWWSEALHGVASVGPGIHFNGTIKAATSFPQVILTASSFDAYQWYRIGQVRVN